MAKTKKEQNKNPEAEELETPEQKKVSEELKKIADESEAVPIPEKAVPEYNQKDGLAKIEEMLSEKLKNAKGPVIVEIAGGSASGKGVTSSKLQEMYGEDLTYIAVDDYYRGGKFVEDEAKKGNIINFDQPEALDLDRFRKDLAALRRGESIEKPIFDFKRGEPSGKTAEVKPSKIVVADGLFVLEDDIAEQGDIRVFVEVGAHGRIIRRLLRDVERTSQKPKDILNYFAKFVQPMHDKYIESTKSNADLVINNEYNPGVESLRAGLHEKQLKFKAGEISREQLLTAGARLVDSVEQSDIYYDPSDRNLAETDEMLRIRKEKKTSEGAEERIILTYKGPRMKGSSQTLDRPKFEFEIDPDVAKNILSLYPNAVKVIKKKRELYELDGVEFSLDEVSTEQNGEEVPLGKYLELRSSNKTENAEAAEEAVKRLGLQMSNGVKMAYAEM